MYPSKPHFGIILIALLFATHVYASDTVQTQDPFEKRVQENTLPIKGFASGVTARFFDSS